MRQRNRPVEVANLAFVVPGPPHVGVAALAGSPAGVWLARRIAALEGAVADLDGRGAQLLAATGYRRPGGLQPQGLAALLATEPEGWPGRAGGAERASSVAGGADPDPGAPAGPAGGPWDALVSLFVLGDLDSPEQVAAATTVLLDRLAPGGLLAFAEPSALAQEQHALRRAVGRLATRLPGPTRSLRVRPGGLDVPTALRQGGCSLLDLERFSLAAGLLPEPCAAGVARRRIVEVTWP